MNLADALDTVRRVAAVRTTDVQTLALARAHRRVLAESMLTPGGSTVDPAIPGHVLTPLRIAEAAGAGVEIVRVRRRPTIAVFVVDGPQRPAIDAAQALLVGLLRADGLEPTAWPALPADARSVEIAIRDAGCAFDAIAVCGDAAGLQLVDAVLGTFGDIRIDALDIEGAAGAARFATLDAACVFALPLHPLALTGLHLTLIRALVDALEARAEPRPMRRGRLDGSRRTPAGFEWAGARVDSSGNSTLMPLDTGGDETSVLDRIEPNVVLLPENMQADAIAHALPLPDA